MNLRVEGTMELLKDWRVVDMLALAACWRFMQARP